MDRVFKQFGRMIIDKKEEIAGTIHSAAMAGVTLTEQEMQEFSMIEGRILELRAEFVSLFGEALMEFQAPEKAEKRVNQWGRETGEYFFKLGAPLDAALKETRLYRTFIWKVIEKEAVLQGTSPAAVFKMISIIDPLLDMAVHSFSLSYVENHQRTLENAKNAFLELSVPVVPLTRGVGILPLIGNLDTERAGLLMEETLQRASQLKLSYLIMDVSGVMIVDTMVADQLFKVMDALALTGVKTIITGVRPEVAQTMVSLGLKLDELVVKSTLAQAIDHIQILKG
ncbi:STAS domain-containing protein [Peribacillus sp. SCS-37]|uniref:STAS domain-containing protein n=1 Tax=Paraperibacillus esterisolvens TaxID=3115296 RepID=UPI00390681B8